MKPIEARTMRRIFCGCLLAIAGMGLLSGCAGKTDAATPSPPSSSASAETALLTSLSVVLHFNPDGFFNNTHCSGVPIRKNGNVIDVLTAGTCIPSPYMESSWGSTMKLLFIDSTTQEMRVITPHDAKGVADKNSGLALVTVMLDDHHDVESFTPVKMSEVKLSPKTNYNLTALALAGGVNNEEKLRPDSGFDASQLLNKYQVHGIVPAQNSSEFKDCEGSSELKRMA